MGKSTRNCSPWVSLPSLHLLANSNNACNRSVDCWALGVLTFEYTAGYTPFQSPGEPTDITALFTRIAGSKVATSKDIFPSNYDQKVRRLDSVRRKKETCQMDPTK